MKFFSLQCDCGCENPLFMVDEKKQLQMIPTYRTRILAELAAAEFTRNGHQPLVKQFELKQIYED